MKKIAIICIFWAIISGFSIPGLAQTDINLIDTPTAKVLSKNSYYLNFRFYQGGGILLQGWAGLIERLTIGASYGGVGVVGIGQIIGNPEPAFSLKYNLGEEGENFPFALAAGYEGQGYGRYYRQGEMINGCELTKSFYQINSKGFYLALTKKLKNLNFQIHGGVNHCLENDPGKADISFFLGTEFEITPKFIIKLEYNNGFHNKIKPEDVFKNPCAIELRKAGGEINLGLKVRYSSALILEIGFKDLSGVYTENGNRIFQIAYVGEF